jgi:cytochrome c oxidase subunit 4
MAHRIVQPKTYYVVFVVLLGLLVLTVLAARLDNGWVNTIVALLIAVSKALLIVWFFMHLKYSSRFTRVIASAALVWLAILFTLLASDYATRGWRLMTGAVGHVSEAARQ